MAEIKNGVGPGQFWLDEAGDIFHIVERHVIAIEDNWTANVARKDGSYQDGVEIYGYDLMKKISIREAESQLKTAQAIRERKAHSEIVKFLN